MKKTILMYILLAGCASTPAVPTETAEPKATNADEAAEPEKAPATEEAPAPEETPKELDFKIVGLEVVGYKTVKRDILVQDTPLKVGDSGEFPTPEVRASWKEAGAKRAGQLGLAVLNYSVVKFGDGKTYLVVDVLEKDDTKHLKYRDQPGEDLQLPKELAEITEKMEQRFQELFSTGQFQKLAEDVSKGYLTYPKDETLNALAEQARQIAPAQRKTLLKLVKSAKDPQVRSNAATLLHWAGDTHASIDEVIKYADDPNTTVRNNVTRFALQYLPTVTSKTTKTSVAEAVCNQLYSPAHSDRNKSLFALLFIVQSKDDIALIPDHCWERVELVAEQSILDNVGGVAKQLIAKKAEFQK